MYTQTHNLHITSKTYMRCDYNIIENALENKSYQTLINSPIAGKDIMSLLWAIYYMEQSKSYETHKGYESHWNMYLKWCFHYKIVPLPYDKIKKLLYSAHRARFVQLSTVRKDNTAIEYYHNKYGYPDDPNKKDGMYKQLIEGIQKCYGAFDRDPRVPILWEDLERMYYHFDLTIYNQLVYFTSYVISSQACLRVEELYPTTTDVSVHKQDRASIRALFCRNLDVKFKEDGSIAYMLLTLRATKNDKRKKPIHIALGHGKWPLAPVPLMMKYLQRRLELSKIFPQITFNAHAPLFQMYDGTILTQRAALQQLRYVAGKVGLPVKNITLYSLRYGTATSLARRNVDHDIIKAVGRWHTDAYKSYVKMKPGSLVNLMKLYQQMPIVNENIEFTHEGQTGFEHIPQ